MLDLLNPKICFSPGQVLIISCRGFAVNIAHVDELNAQVCSIDLRTTLMNIYM